MTAPGGEFSFVDGSDPRIPPESVPLEPVEAIETPPKPLGYPDAILSIPEEKLTAFKLWLDHWLLELTTDQSKLQSDWSDIEKAYDGGADPSISSPPFKGACMDVIPVMAMAVDPIHARLDIGIFKQEPVFSVKPYRRDMKNLAPSLSAFIDAYQRNYLKLHKISSPRLLELTKLGTCIFKTVYDREQTKSVTYDEQYKVVTKNMIKFSGPRVSGISIGDFLFPPNYQDIQDCPIVFERQRTTFDKLKVLEYSKKLAHVDSIKAQQVTNAKTPLEGSREDAVGHKSGTRINELVVWEGWCDYDIDGDGLPEKLVVTYHYETGTIIQLRYNWYFHQKKPYSVIPFTVVNESIYGLGIGKMARPFQLAITRFHRMASDNAYIANIRMFIAKKNSGIEEVPRLYSGRVFFVDDPTRDFIPFQAGDIYPSTLAERQNLFGMVEKRTGVSDYLTGRESPIIGSRATATSTLALIQEGAKRVEEVLENVRGGFSEIVEFCIAIWIQYGTGGIEDIFFGGDQIAKDVKDFFNRVTHDNVNGMVGVELTATDPASSKVQMQQLQLSIIQVMMQYLEKVLQAGQGAIQAQMQQIPQYTEMVKDVMEAARQMFKDLLHKYDIRNAEDYLPDLRKYLDVPVPSQLPAGSGDGSSDGGSVGGIDASAGVSSGLGPSRPPPIPGPATPGSGAGSRIAENVARASQG